MESIGAALGFPRSTTPTIKITMPTKRRIVPTEVSAVVMLNVTFWPAPERLGLIAPTRISPPSGWLRVNDPLVPVWIVTPDIAEALPVSHEAEHAAEMTSTVPLAVQETDTGMLPVRENPLTLRTAYGEDELVSTF